MLKYFIIAKNTLQEYFVYRINFIFWRLQVLISFLIFYYLWFSVASGQSRIGVYSIDQIYAYFIVGYIIRALVFSTRTGDIGGEIQNGRLSILLLKPIGTIKYYFSRDLIDKIFNLFFMIFEFGLILIMFRPILMLPSSFNLIYSIIFLLLAMVMFFFYSLIISFISFWSDSAWSSRFLFGVVFINLFSGQYMPIDLLPGWIGSLLKITPFPYLYYYPIRTWLGLEPATQIYQYLLLAILHLIFLVLLSQFMWQRGKLKFQSYGN